MCTRLYIGLNEFGLFFLTGASRPTSLLIKVNLTFKINQKFQLLVSLSFGIQPDAAYIAYRTPSLKLLYQFSSAAPLNVKSIQSSTPSLSSAILISY